ncbi:CFC_HP_G0008450.mRNA.1.CDS.1 [Saccharomyces cerevisiae]|nr:CFC_HP_G0008450.mRNA.1.CDS.1 [Saccharomyces cerevisiae]CAI6925418.1 CFC_HP_G0008450.mRNA.1.CDS.1 [Saccharomyces cerevisiae]
MFLNRCSEKDPHRQLGNKNINDIDFSHFNVAIIGTGGLGRAISRELAQEMPGLLLSGKLFRTRT